jgi:hypothetical protein
LPITSIRLRARTLVDAGLPERAIAVAAAAEQAAHSITDSPRRLSTLAKLARTLVDAGLAEGAVAVAAAAEEVVHSIMDPEGQAMGRAVVALALAEGPV